MKQTIKATTKAAEEFANRLEAIGAGMFSSINECNAEFAKQLNNALEPLFRSEERRAKRWTKAFEKLDKQQQERLTVSANAMAKGMRQFQKAWRERYNIQNMQENLKRHREAKR